MLNICLALSVLVYEKKENILVNETDKVVFISFKGTSSTYDMFRYNIYSMFVSKTFQFMHMNLNVAIKAYLLEIFNKYRNVIESHVYGKKHVVFTGHSLGGFLAHVFAEIYGKHAVSFGSPRFFKRLDKVGGTHVRVMHKYDKVPFLPNENLWCHAPGLCVILPERKIIKDNTGDKIRANYVSQVMTLYANIFNMNYNYHLILNYLRAFNNH